MSKEQIEMNNKPWIAVDLDGTLAKYETWEGPTHIGPPIPVMVERVRRWLDDGVVVKVFTARVSEPDEETRRDIIIAIQDWTLANIGHTLEVTNVKDYAMLELWDDRAVQVEANTGRVLGYSTRGFTDAPAPSVSFEQVGKDFLRLAELDEAIDNADGWGAAMGARLEERDDLARKYGLPARRRKVE